jgi:uncharacterized protein (TIGR00661 family)
MVSYLPGKYVLTRPQTDRPKVFFALASEGMGHATRAAPLIESLRTHGYDVEVFCGGRVADYLRKRTGPVNEHFFIPLIYKDNVLDFFGSFLHNVKRLPSALGECWRMFWRMRNEKPVAVISDFEFMSAWMAWWSGTPVIACDNMHVISHGAMPAPRNDEERVEKRHVELAIFWNQPVVDKVLITSFYQPGLKAGVDDKKVRFVPCATRPEVLARKHKTRTDGPILVYQTSSSNKDLPGTLAAAAEQGGLQFVVYGMGRTGVEETTAGRVEYRAFSESGFLDDMAAAPFVIVNGGHSTMVEAIALGKPVLSEPIRKQYEQEANAIGLEEMGIGQGVKKMSTEAILAFAARAPELQKNVAKYQHIVDNDGLAAAVVDTLVELNPEHAIPARLAEVTSMHSLASAHYALAAE